jgi:hypothetical protein
MISWFLKVCFPQIPQMCTGYVEAARAKAAAQATPPAAEAP